MLGFIPYLIIGIPLGMLLYHFRTGRMGGLQFITVGALTTLMVLYFLIHSGIAGRYIVKWGDDDFFISETAFEKIVSENLDKFAYALSQIYSQRSVSEAYSIGQESDRVAYAEDNQGKFVLKLKLSHTPMPKTIRLEVSQGRIMTNPDEPFDKVDSDNYISIPVDMPTDKVENWIKNTDTIIVISYLKDLESPRSGQ